MTSSAVPDVPDYVASGEEARLIPVLADKSKERRAASVFLRANLRFLLKRRFSDGQVRTSTCALTRPRL